MALQTYCSPLRYQQGGYGITDTGTTLALRNKLVQASATVDRWCNAGLMPQMHDFRGGTITGEQHLWQPPTPLLNEPGNRRIFLSHRPIRTVSQVVIKYTNTYELIIPSDQLFISQAGFIEIIALNPTIIGFPPLGWMIGPYEPFSVTDYTYGWQFMVGSDVLEAVSPTVYMASHGSWLEGGAVSVSLDNVTVDPADYTVNIDDGTVTFTTAPTANQVVAASYIYTLPTAFEAATALIATDAIGQARIASRGMIGLSSIKVAEVAITAMAPSQYVTRNGVSIPPAAAALLEGFAIGSIG